MKQTVIMGMPYFIQKEGENFRAPYGSVKLFQTLFQKRRTPRELTECLMSEYLSVAEKIKEMGYAMKILSCLPELQTLIEDSLKIECVKIGKDFPHPLYPRDAWVSVPGTDMLIIPGCMPEGAFIFADANVKRLVNRFGEGGKVFLAGDYFITTRITDGDDPLQFTGLVESRKHLPKLDKKFILLQNPFVVEQIKGGPKGYMPETHVDRFMTVVVDKRGETHVLLDPDIYAGWKHPLQKPTITVEQSLRMMKDTLKSSGIYHIHIPRRLCNPYGLGAVQFGDGRVLMTSEEPHVEAILQAILGTDAVFTTSVPIVHYGALFRAGVRCLVNEI